MKSKRDKHRLIIIDDHPIVRIGLKQIISLEKDLEVCGEAASANEAISLISKIQPDLIIVDLSLDGDMSGLDIIKAVNSRFTNIKILVISMHEESLYIDRAIRAGAQGYILKKYAYNTIIEAIHHILAGKFYLSDSMSQQLINKMYFKKNSTKEQNMDSLSNRELEIFQMIGKGHDTRDIAKKLGLSENTIQTYKRHIREKLGIKNHNDLVRQATLNSGSA